MSEKPKTTTAETSKLDATAAAFTPAAPAAQPGAGQGPAPVAVVQAAPLPVPQPVIVAPAHHIINGMGPRTGDPEYAQVWTFIAIQQDLLARIGAYAQFPGGAITITGGLHQNFGDVLGPHYSVKDSSGSQWHVYPRGGEITTI